LNKFHDSSQLKKSLSSTAQNKNELKRIDWHVVKRLIASLHHHGSLKKTQIATMCNMSYDKCRRYLDWLEIMELIKKEIDDRFEMIILTEKGRALYSRKFSEAEIFK
jgi:predicted transcriptional regulator